jgi:raffinose synthase
MKAYQEAFQSSGALYMNNELLHCMSHGSDVLYNSLASNCMRNSADYLPRAPLDQQQYHLVMNAYNALFVSMVAIPDWDMFQTHAPGAALHAAARAISGGPLYVCDYPGKQDFALLDALSISGGRIVRCSRPAVAAADCLFEDCHNDSQRLLKITNKNDAAGVVGIFHVSTRTEHLRGSVGPADVHDLQGTRFALWYSRGQRLETISARKRRALTLEPAGWELLHFVPIVQGVAALGLLDKLNCAGAVRATSSTERGTFVCVLEDGSNRTGFYCERMPSMVLVNGRSTRFTYDSSSGLLELKTAVGRAHRVEIGLALAS